MLLLRCCLRYAIAMMFIYVDMPFYYAHDTALIVAAFPAMLL